MSWMKRRVWPPLARRTVSTSSAQAGHEAIVADAQQRAARHVADAGRLDDDRAGPPCGEALVPVEHVVGDDAVVGGAPGDHGGHPGAVGEVEAAAVERREPARRRRLVRGRPACRRQRVPHAARRMPHRDDILSLNDLFALDAPGADGSSYGVAGAASRQRRRDVRMSADIPRTCRRETPGPISSATGPSCAIPRRSTSRPSCSIATSPRAAAAGPRSSWPTVDGRRTTTSSGCTDRIGKALTRLGVRPGDRVALRFLNNTTVCRLVARRPEDRRGRRLDDADAPRPRARLHRQRQPRRRCSCAPRDLMDEVARARPSFDHAVVVVDATLGGASAPPPPGADLRLDDALAGETPGLDAAPRAPRDLALIAYTSGSTGIAEGRDARAGRHARLGRHATRASVLARALRRCVRRASDAGVHVRARGAAGVSVPRRGGDGPARALHAGRADAERRAVADLGALLRRDDLPAAAAGSGARAEVRSQVAARLRERGRAAARSGLRRVAPADRRRDPRRHRLDRDVPHLHLRRRRAGRAPDRPACRCRATRPGSSTTRCSEVPRGAPGTARRARPDGLPLLAQARPPARVRARRVEPHGRRLRGGCRRLLLVPVPERRSDHLRRLQHRRTGDRERAHRTSGRARSGRRRLAGRRCAARCPRRSSC